MRPYVCPHMRFSVCVKLICTWAHTTNRLEYPSDSEREKQNERTCIIIVSVLVCSFALLCCYIGTLEEKPLHLEGLPPPHTHTHTNLFSSSFFLETFPVPFPFARKRSLDHGPPFWDRFGIIFRGVLTDCLKQNLFKGLFLPFFFFFFLSFFVITLVVVVVGVVVVMMMVMVVVVVVVG